mgnify:CR=1 FL=1
MSLPLLGAGMATDGPSAVLDLNFASLLSLTPSVGPTPSFTRASTGTYFDASGVLTTAAINGPRFDHVYNGSSWVSKGLLVEEQRTNSVFYSEQFNLWTRSRCNATSDSIAAPDGNTTADLLTTSISDAANGPYVYSNNAPSGQTTVSSSIFVKKGNCDYLRFDLYDSAFSNGVFSKVNISTGAIISTSSIGTGWAVTSSDIVNCGSGWYRVTLNATKPSGSTTAILSSYSSAVAVNAVLGDTVYLWGAQIETGSSFPTSYIPTTTATVTRSADVCQITGGDFSGFWNASEGSFAVEFDIMYADEYQSTTYLAYQSGTSWIGQRRSTGVGIYLDVYVSNIQQARLIASSPTAGTLFRSAGSYKANDFACSFNGAAVLTDAVGSLPSPTSFTIGNFPTFGEYHNGHIARLRYFNTRLINSQLVALST